MKYRTLGQGLKVSAIGIGCMPMIKGGNIAYGADADPQEAIKTIHRAIEMGVTFFDTAQIYGPFQNEELILKGPLCTDVSDGRKYLQRFRIR